MEPLNGGPRNIVPENGRRCTQEDYPFKVVTTSYSRIPGALDNVARWSRWILARGRHSNEYDWHEHLHDFSFVLKQSDILPTSCQLFYLGLSLNSIRYRSKFRQDGTPYSHLSSWVLWRLTPSLFRYAMIQAARSLVVSYFLPRGKKLSHTHKLFNLYRPWKMAQNCLEYLLLYICFYSDWGQKVLLYSPLVLNILLTSPFFFCFVYTSLAHTPIDGVSGRKRDKRLV